MINVPRMLHIMQLESYQNDGMFRWITKNPKLAFKKGAIQFLVTGAVYLLTGTLIVALKEHFTSSLMIYLVRIGITNLVFVIINVIMAFKDYKEIKNAKKPLKYTSRAKRLLVFNFFILVMLQFLFLGYFNDIDYFMIQPILFSFFIFTLPVNMIIANWFARPTEDAINNHYINQARKILRKKEYKNLIKIGITGSYGKTSTKFILKSILSEKYNVLATPGSYNTTMGNVRVIREQLKPEHNVFISEMGARKRFDIQEICQFVKPTIGLITSIGPQHLETFKNIENVAKTKAELLNGVEEEGAVFLPKDNSHCFELYKKDNHKKFLYSTKKDGSDVYAKNIKVTKEGSTFTVATKKGEFDCKTKLLGEHNVQNIMGCVAIAEYLGLTNEEIQRGIEKIEPVVKRIEWGDTSVNAIKSGAMLEIGKFYHYMNEAMKDSDDEINERLFLE